jgi:gliding motility-associated-like protein
MRYAIYFFVLSIVLNTSALSQPIASFSASATSGCAPLAVTFQNASSGAVSYEWNTGAGSSTLASPAAFYAAPGLYTVRLVAIDGAGRRDTLTLTDYIRVYAPPQAQFAAAPLQVCAHQPLQFSDQSQPGEGSIASWAWDFGDGDTSQSASPLHAYGAGGQYPVSLTVTNSFGCSDFALYPAYVSVNAPDPAFGADQRLACGPPLQVQFQATGSSSGQHSWLFGDGSSAQGLSPQHTYLSQGAFTVTHIVENSQGCRDTLTQPSYINIGLNTLGISADDSTICARDTVFFSAFASPNAAVSWSFGDGGSSSERNPAHIYYTPGQYSATATISDVSGCTNVLQIPITVYALPEASFAVADTNVGCSLPFSVQFVNLSTGGQSYSWNFGDGSSSTAFQPSHVYQSLDSFNVRLEVRGPGGCLSVRNIDRYIQIRPLQAGFETDVREGCAPLAVAFEDTTQSPFPMVAWRWRFGDGGMGFSATPAHTYQSPGTYDVELIVENSRGCRDTVLRPAYIRAGALPQVNFTADTQRACALAEIQFINLSSGANEYLWLFGDGDTAMSLNPAHGFAALGMLDVSLIASDRGCRDTLHRNDFVEILAPLPIMSVSDRQICSLPRLVSFSNLSVGDDAWWWNLNGGPPISARDFTHTFTQVGSQFVQLTVTNYTTGCSVSVSDSIYIVLVEAALAADTLRGCVPLRVQFEDRSLNARRWWWFFGTGDSSLVQNPAYEYETEGNYPLTLVVENRLRCRDTLVLSSVEALDVHARFSAETASAGCIPLEVQFKDESYGTGTVVHWAWGLGTGDSSSLPNPTQVYDSVGSYDISLEVRDADGCSDRIVRERFVLATQPRADFFATPRINCPGAPMTFVSLSEGAGLTYEWDFGDGSTSFLANPVHNYASVGNYTITLRVTDVNGCDTLLQRPAYVQIREIEAQFAADTTYASCPPLSVLFVADTTNPHERISYRWDFGNGASAQQPMPTHIFALPGEFDIRLIVSTPEGCADTLIRPAYIEVDGPSAQFEFSPDEGCPDTEVQFSAYSPETISYNWLFGDGSTGSGQQAAHRYGTPGQFTPVLLVEDSSGCKVYHVAPGLVTIFPPPQAAFSVSEPRLCQPDSVWFGDLSQGEAPLASWDWDLGNGQSASGAQVAGYYSQVGDYDVRLIVSDARGCRDTLLRPAAVRLLPNVMPEVTPIRVASVEGDREISLEYEPFPNLRDDFGAYRIYRDAGSGYLLAGELNQASQTRWVDDLPGLYAPAQSYCYKLQVVNFCGTAYDLAAAEPHCTINLETQAGMEEVSLSWSPYVGWPSVESYRIYRTEGPAPTLAGRRQVATVPGSQLAWRDTSMRCYDTYSYWVEAVGRQGLSLSDSAYAVPGRYLPQNPSHVVRATVEDNRYVLLEWETQPIPDARDLLIERNEGSGFRTWFQQPYLSPRVKFQDTRTRVAEASYQYRIFVVDSCGDYSPLGQPGNSIWLRARQGAGIVYLEWTPYEGWENGVLRYRVEAYNEALGLYELMGTVGPGETQFRDERSDPDQPQLCYRVWAEEAGGRGAVSLSNEACVTLAPVVFIPSGFTPNGDGFNDRFEFKGIFVAGFELLIYNRWGQEVFRSGDPGRFWEGLTPEGATAPEGVYAYRLTAYGHGGQVLQRSGTITLLR